VRRLAVVLSVLLIMVLGVVAITSRPGAIAQEATPAGGDAVMGEEEIFAVLSYGVAEILPPAPAGVLLLRLNLEPGDSFELVPEDPATGVLYMETGTLTVNVPVPMTVLRAAGPGTPFPMVNEDTENVAASTDFMLSAGDFTIFPPRIEGEVHNDGSETASALVVNIGAIMEGVNLNQAATPAP
jgi:hypothetical protein